ncbi:tetratricopeptide repeat protein [Streptomyces sp. NPDC001351]|uniref:tetratricopeptide repeat protein n=1 Tax=Streptomyces sp. NPDC001351 TaxID=3364564 RepID=UPI00368C297C
MPVRSRSTCSCGEQVRQGGPGGADGGHEVDRERPVPVPHTLAIRSSLATLAARAGRHDEAQSRFSSLIEDRTRLLEPEHPDVIRSRLDRVQALADAGYTQQARIEGLSILHTRRTRP